MKLQTIFAAAILAAASTAFAAPFTAGNVVVYRIGDGSAALSGASTAVFLDEYTPAGALVQSITVPSSGTDALTNSGSATSEGLLTRSVDGRYLTFAGYRSDTGVASIASSAVATVARVAGRVDWNGNVDTTTTITDAFNANNARAAFTVDGSNIYVVGGNSGVIMQAFGSSAPSTVIANNLTNIRGINAFDGQLYVSSASGAFRLATVGTGIPNITGQTITNLPADFPTATISPYGFFVQDADTVWIADDRALASGGGLNKYTRTAGIWGATPTPFNTGLTNGLRGLSGKVNGLNLTLVGTDTATPARLLLFTSTDGGATGTWSVIATAATNTVFRGAAFAPEDSSNVSDWAILD